MEQKDPHRATAKNKAHGFKKLLSCFSFSFDCSIVSDMDGVVSDVDGEGITTGTRKPRNDITKTDKIRYAQM